MNLNEFLIRFLILRKKRKLYNYVARGRGESFNKERQ